MKRVISLLLSGIMICSLLVSSAQITVFDHNVFSSLPGYVSNHDSKSWRYEQYCESDSVGICFALGFVAGQEPGEELDAPWVWAEYSENDAAKVITGAAIQVDGALYEYTNLDLIPDKSYATWNLGNIGHDMIELLQDAQEIEVMVTFDNRTAEFVLDAANAGGIRQWAGSILSSNLYSFVDEQVLLAYDNADRPKAVIPLDQGGFSYMQFEALTGYKLDKIEKVWRYERCVETEENNLYFGLGFVADGYVQGAVNYPWAWVEYRSARGDEPISMIKILADDTLFTFSGLKVSDGYSSWTLGKNASAIAAQLAGAREMVVKIYFGDYTKDFSFDETQLEPLKSWGSALDSAQVFSLLDQKTLDDFDELHKVTVE